MVYGWYLPELVPCLRKGRHVACPTSLQSLHRGFAFANAKHVVHRDASITAQSLFGSVAACRLNLASYCNHGVSSYSSLALMMIELYANKSPIRSDCFRANTVVYVLKHNAHCWIFFISFRGLELSGLVRTSRIVGSGMPNLAGRRSCNSINSFLHIFCAIFNGIGGEEGPTGTASAEGLGMGCMTDAKGVDGVIILMTALVVELGVTVTPEGLLLAKVGSAAKAVPCGMSPSCIVLF